MPDETSIQVPHRTETRIFDPLDYVKDEVESPLDHLVYADEDLDALVWWADPGESHLDIHKHPCSAHVYVILEGEGEALMGPGTWVPVRKGQVVVFPRQKPHALRNTMEQGRLIWVSTTAVGAGPYQMVPATEDEE